MRRINCSEASLVLIPQYLSRACGTCSSIVATQTLDHYAALHLFTYQTPAPSISCPYLCLGHRWEAAPRLYPVARGKRPNISAAVDWTVTTRCCYKLTAKSDAANNALDVKQVAVNECQNGWPSVSEASSKRLLQQKTVRG